MEQLKEISHKHPLILKENNHKFYNFIYIPICRACGDVIPLLGPYYYACRECLHFVLHKFCAELPSKMQHHMHPNHPPLTLTSNEYYPHTRMCHSCKHSSHNIAYHCSECNFSLCIKCATILQRQFYHPSHQHPLSRISRPVLAMCDACGFKHESIFYHCTTCGEYCVHESSQLYSWTTSETTLSIQETTHRRYHHDHELCLAYSLPQTSSSDQFQPKCEICDKEFKPLQWLYSCKESCNYFVHYSCAGSMTEPFMSILLPLGKFASPSSNPKAPRLPFPDQSHSFIRHDFYSPDKSNDKYQVTVDFTDIENSLHSQKLVLFDVETSNNRDASSPETKLFSSKIKPLCYVCVKPITKPPFYKCLQNQCNDLIIHKWCAKLKLKARIGNYPRFYYFNLVIKDPDSSNSSVKLYDCHMCGLKFNGLAFKNKDAKPNQYFDTNCRYLPDSIVHEAHPDHLLHLVDASLAFPCRACFHQPNDKYEFRCAVCNFKLHIRCALLPGSISHRYDDHPLHLTFYPPKNHQDEHFCEICLDEVKTNEWFYHCVDCNQAMHAGCGSLYECGQSQYGSFVHHHDSSTNIKFGGVIKYKSHPHPLSFVRRIENKTTKCAKCGEDFKDEPFDCDIGFSCLRCNYALHYCCALSLESDEQKNSRIRFHELKSDADDKILESYEGLFYKP